MVAGFLEAMLSLFRSLYRRLGPRYPTLVLFGGAPFAVATALLAMAGTALYVDVAPAEFLRLIVAALLLIWSVDWLIAARLIRAEMEPVRAWLAGARSQDDAIRAWESGAGLPLALLGHRTLYAMVVPGVALWDLYATWELDFPAYSAPIFFLGSLVVYLYFVVVRFLALELTVRPVLEDIASSLPDGVSLELPLVPLRWRLLASLPAVNLITGVAVGGFSSGNTDDPSGLGLALLGSAVAAVLVSSWLIGFLSTSIATPIVQLRDATRRIRDGDLSVRVPVASTDESGELTRSFNEMAAGLRERERLREAFGAFVDPELAERVVREGTDLEGEELEVSVLFMDIRDFTSYAEEASAREVVARLNDLYECVVPVISRHGGHANKFSGDGLLAVFGAPERLADHATRAVAAALEIAQTVRERYGDELRVGLGVNSGSVMSGTIGGGGRLDFTVIGDAVNTAARVESATRDTGDDVLITEATRSLVSDDLADWEDRAALALKGKSERVRLFAPAARDGAA
jgi:adenylate cyclase